MSENKKTYNPFRMWGSYVGAYLIPLLLFLFVGGFDYSNLSNPFFYLWFIILLFSNVWYLSFILSGLGFLIGWGIHSLFRRMLG